MRFSKGMLAIVAMVSMAGLSGCANSLVRVHEGSERVSLAEAGQVGNCQSKGGTIISVFAKGRSAEAVETDMYLMARNNAVDAGADTIVKGESTEFGRRTFHLYKCRP